MATSNKYDRQLRLWGASGQKALAETSVILVNPSSSGTESLKNLVLPGLGHFLIVDTLEHTAVDEVDISSNFFVSQRSDKSKSRAQVTCELLQELNPDVQGSFVIVDTKTSFSSEAWKSDILSQIPSRIQHIVVLASDLNPNLTISLSHVCVQHMHSLIAVQSYGLIGTVRVQYATPWIPIAEPKPRDTPPDLRLSHPFPEFVEYADSLDMKSMDLHTHKHVPYPVILYKIAQQYKQQNNNQLPKAFAEKQAFAQMIKDHAMDYNEELNYHEATRNAYLAYATPSNATNKRTRLLQTIEQQTNNHHASLSSFVALVRALHTFAQRHGGQIPLTGTIPDMTASTLLYVQLQTLYQQQAAKDVNELQTILQEQQASESNSSVTLEQIQSACQTASHWDLLVNRTIFQEYSPGSPPETVVTELQSAWEEVVEEAGYNEAAASPELTPLLWYGALSACGQFETEHGRYPGTVSKGNVDDPKDPWKQDIPAVTQYLMAWLQKYGLSTVSKEQIQNIATEVTRYGDSEIHNVAAVVGGVASQEVVKLITGQYTPIHNTYVYNGIASIGGVYEF